MTRRVTIVCDVCEAEPATRYYVSFHPKVGKKYVTKNAGIMDRCDACFALLGTQLPGRGAAK